MAPILPPGPVTIPAQNPGGSCHYKASDIITMAMLEIGAIDPDETPSGPEMNTGLYKLNRMLDAWNADRRYVYAMNFTQYPLIPNIQPTTIGPSGNFVVPQRPVKIEEANIILNAGSNSAVRCPMAIRDKDWWANKRTYAVPGTLPTDLYYQPGWPNGSLFIWIVPTVNYPIELVTWILLSQLALTDSFCFPPGYLDAVVYSLALSISPSFQRPISPDLRELCRQAVQRIMGPNTASPTIATQDAGMPDAGKQKPYFNWLSGLPT
jgi:hypothetical protein